MSDPESTPAPRPAEPAGVPSPGEATGGPVPRGTAPAPAQSPAHSPTETGLLVIAGVGLIGSSLADLAEACGWRVRLLHRDGSTRSGLATRHLGLTTGHSESTATHPTPDRPASAGTSAGAVAAAAVDAGPGAREHATWDPTARYLPAEALAGARAVVCLSGAPIAARPWTPARRRELAVSRLATTVTVARAVAALAAPDRPEVLVTGSAVGFYGSRGDELLTEVSAQGEGFLAELCRRWESASSLARRAGVRTVQSRTGLVIARDGGMGPFLHHLYRAGLGARLGDGSQWQAYVSRRDAVAGILWAIEHDDVAGPVNLVAPEPVRNADLHSLLSSTYRLPSLAVAPRAALALGGAMVRELVLASQRAVPTALTASGFRFRDADAASIWATELGVGPKDRAAD